MSIAWTELLRVAGRLDATPDEGMAYARELHDEVVGEPSIFTVGEALRRRGVLAGMRLAKSPDGVLSVLDFGPVVACLPWRHGLIYPRSGVVTSITGDGEYEQAGATELLHCHVLVARHARLERRGVSRVDDVIEFRASLGARWALGGTGYMRVDDLRELSNYALALPGFGFIGTGPVWPEEVG